MDISVVSAFLAGAVSFLSPCVLPLVPPYLCYMAGVSMDDFRGQTLASADGTLVSRPVRLPLVLASLAFIAGFTTVFVALGAGASTVGVFLRTYQDILAKIAGVIIIIMGLNFLGLFRIGLLSREARFQAGNMPTSPLAAYVMGLAFAFGWTPCIGPVLGPILTLAGSRESVTEGAGLLAVYSAGLGVPFLLAAVFSGAFMQFQTNFRRHMGTVEKVIGAFLVLAGILFLTGGIQTMSYWLLEQFPALATLG